MSQLQYTGEGQESEDDIMKAIYASKSLMDTLGGDEVTQQHTVLPKATPSPFAKSAQPSKARLRWQRAIRKVLDNLDEMLNQDLDNPCLTSTMGPMPGQRQASGETDRFKGFGSRTKVRGLGPPSNSLQRSKRHSATFKLQKVVEELLRNKSTFQRIQYEQTKQQIMETNKG